MRRPTDLTAAWAHWRDRINGVPRAVTPDQPQPGLYRARRHGRHVGVQIDLVQEIDPATGELIAEERFVAFVGADAFYDRRYIDDVWLRCAGNPISEAEFARLQAMPAVDDLTRAVIV